MRLGLGRRLCCCPFTHKLLDYNDPTKVIWERDYLDGYFDNVGIIEAVACLESGPPGEFGVLVERMTDGRGAFSVYNSQGARLWQTLENTNIPNVAGYSFTMAYGAENHVWAVITNVANNTRVYVFDGDDGSLVWETDANDGPPIGFVWAWPGFDADGNVYWLEYDTAPDGMTGLYDQSRILKYSDTGDWISTSGKTIMHSRPLYVGDELYVPVQGGGLSSYGYRVYDLSGSLISTVSLPMTDGDNTQTSRIAVDGDGAAYLVTGHVTFGGGVNIRKVEDGDEVWASPVSAVPNDGRLAVDGLGRVWWHNLINGPGVDALIALDTDSGSIVAVSDAYYPSSSTGYGKDFCLINAGVVWGGIRTRS